MRRRLPAQKAKLSEVLKLSPSCASVSKLWAVSELLHKDTVDVCRQHLSNVVIYEMRCFVGFTAECNAIG